MNEYQHMRAESMEEYIERNAPAMVNAYQSSAWFRSQAGLQNAYRPSIHEKDSLLCERLGIPSVMEDIQ